MKPGKKFDICLISLLGLLLASKVFAAGEIIYPEERVRQEWDKGCADWQNSAPYISDIAVDTLRKEGVFRIFAAARMTPSPGQSVESTYQIVSKILSNGLEYPEWVMPGINADPEGNPYFVKIESAQASRYRSSYEYAIQGMFSLSVLWIKRDGGTSIVFKHHQSPLPSCPKSFDLSAPQIATKVVYRMVPRPGVLDYMIGEAYVSRNQNHVDLKLRAVLKPANALYQVIPQKLIRTQVDQRARRIFQNFLKTYSEKSP